MMNKLVSIITPTYNSEEFVSETIDCIIAQTYQDWELLITDDCSTDSTRKIVREYVEKDSRIRLFTLEHNSGAGAARNNSLEHAGGRYIAFCDSDDRWTPDKLEKQLAFMQEKDCALSYASYHICNEEGNIKGLMKCRAKETFASMKRDDKMGCLTVVYDTEKVGKVPFPLLRKRQDWGMKLLVLQKCKVAYGISEPLAIYRKRSDSISRNKLSLVKYNIAVYEQVLGWSSLHARLFFFLVFMPTYIVKRITNKISNL